MVVLSISIVVVFAECLAAETNTTGMNSTAFSLLIGMLVIFTFHYIFRYLLKLHIDKIAVLNTLGIRTGQLLVLFSVVILVSSLIIFGIGSIVGRGIFEIVQRKYFSIHSDINVNVYIKAIMSFLL